MLAHRGLVAASLLSLATFPAFAQDLPPTPAGVEVQARGPIHEAYASLTGDPVPTKVVPKAPPAPIEELPPAEKPEGDVIWISGYWGWDDDRSDYLWVSGVWRVVPPGKQWVAGYWRTEGDGHQWVPGFWTTAQKGQDQQITYLPAPPVAPEVAAPGKAPSAESFYIPGTWFWTGDRYVWRAGYWGKMQPGYVWVPDHYRWTPTGYVYVPGYWDLALKRRGILYAPVIIRPEVVTVGFTYTPAYAVRDTVVVEALFVRPTACHYYFGDYYGPSYRTLGYESCVVYSRRRYDSIVVYECYERRDPAWVGIQINLFNDRCAGRAPCPPRTLVQQNTIVNNTTVVNNNTTVVNNNTTIVNNNTLIAPTKQVAATKNTSLVKLDDTTRQQAKTQAVAVQQVAKQRVNTEVKPAAGAPREARVASLNVAKTEAVKPGMTAPTVKPVSAKLDKPVTAAAAAKEKPPLPNPAAKAEPKMYPLANANVKTPPATAASKPTNPQPPRWTPATPTTGGKAQAPVTAGRPVPTKAAPPTKAGPPKPKSEPARRPKDEKDGKKG